MSSALPVFRHTRNAIHKAVKDLSQEQAMAIPDGHDNNVAWNIGHVVAVQQRVCYGRNGLDMNMSEEMQSMYLPGTSPADWDTEPDFGALVTLMMDTLAQHEADHAVGKFGGEFQASTTPSGLHIADAETALMFNTYHEAQHFGMILALNNFVAK
ncbi:MAG: DinB family protein [Chloroflexota bacterium]